ncbi:MAG: LptF/LptG family permease [Candidatus Omnitrophota bacterium]
MRIIERYLLRLFLAPLCYCIFIFLSLYIIMDLFSRLDEIIAVRAGVLPVVIFYLASLPGMLVQVLPMALLISTMYTLGNLARHNEIIAFRASGISVWETLKPFVIAGVFISLMTVVVNDRIVPAAAAICVKIREEKLERKKDGASPGRMIKNVALYGAGNRIIYARIYDPKVKTLKDIVIHEHDRHQNIISKTTAKEAKWTKAGWAGFNISTYKLDEQGQIKGDPLFEHRNILPIEEKPEDFQNQKYNIEALNLSELKSYIKRFSGASGNVLQGLRVEAYTRLSYPFSNLIAVLIGAAFSLTAKRRGGRLMGVGMGLLIGLLFYGVFAVSIALGKGGILPAPVAAWSANLVFGACGMYLINRF